jgi:adenylate cyclase
MHASTLFQFSSFSSRLITYLVILLLGVLGLVFFSVNRSTYNNTRDVIDQNLELGLDVFNQLITERGDNFNTTMRALSSDFAFRTAYETSDYDTLLSVGDNLLARTENADILMMVDYDYLVVADSQRIYTSGEDFPWPWLLQAAEDNEKFETSSFILITETAFHVVAVPILTPLVEGWIIVGERLDADYVNSLKDIISTDVSILTLDERGSGIPLATTLSANQAQELQSEFNSFFVDGTGSGMLDLADEEFIALGTSLVNQPEISLTALVQQSLPAALAPYRLLEEQLILLFTLGLGISALMAMFLGKSVTSPVLKLAGKVQRIEGGDYSPDPPSLRSDEIGQLENSVNTMAEGLAEKEKVRDLLGKVVSKEIADELMNNQVELGGETRTATILFSDIREFTNLCEGRAPKNILALLNSYLSEMSAAIEDHRGVVDKYIGDAVMALFGVPLAGHQDPKNALNAALAMQERAITLNSRNKAAGLPMLHTGIGIHTGEVVAGNLGSTNRLNYTVIGDPVNLASRLESLTKQYGVNIIVSEETAHEQDGFVFRELDLVRVKGKAQPARIFELVGHKESVDQNQLDEIKAFENILSLYRKQQWPEAIEQVATLLEKKDLLLYRLFAERINTCIGTPPDENWDGVFTFESK